MKSSRAPRRRPGWAPGGRERPSKLKGGAVRSSARHAPSSVFTAAGVLLGSGGVVRGTPSVAGLPCTSATMHRCSVKPPQGACYQRAPPSTARPARTRRRCMTRPLAACRPPCPAASRAPCRATYRASRQMRRKKAAEKVVARNSAKPKSVKRGFGVAPRSLSSTFSRFTSPCTTPAACSAAKPLAS